MATRATRRLLHGASTVAAAAAVVVLLVVLASGPPAQPDGPMARMFRAETDITALARAVEVYRDQYGQLPAPGAAGLAAATEAISRRAPYFPQGPPFDPWGRPYVYEWPLPAAASETTGEGPGFGIYSMGADRANGMNPAAQQDNITSWQKKKPWRAHYMDLQKKSAAEGESAHAGL